MDKSVSDYLAEGANFWIARPRFSAAGITGLDTLVSGSYIIMQPGHGDRQDKFKGLDEPPMDQPDTAGHRYTVHTSRLGALTQGSTVYYRGIDVGAVEGYKLNDKGDDIAVYVFVRAPFDRLVSRETRFWNASSVEISPTANGIEVKTEALRALLTGGIAFETPLVLLGQQPAPANTDYFLYDDMEASRIDPRDAKYTYEIDFPGSVHNLKKDAYVELKGVQVGRVKEIRLQVDEANGTVKTPVIIEIEGWRLHLPNFDEAHAPTPAQLDRGLEKMVQKGLRAELATSSLITGQRYVALTIQPDAPPAKLGHADGFTVIPSESGGSLDDLTKTANTVLTHADRVVQNLGTLTGPDELQHTVKTLDETLVDVDKLMGQLNSTVSPLGRQLPQALSELKDAGRSVRELADYLNQHPEALITGRGENQ
jgi:paraquat-inducible protein B